MTAEPLEEAYFEWLAVQVVNIRLRDPRKTNWEVLKQLHSTEFFWRIRNDDNRVSDGLELRAEFLNGTYEGGLEALGCSFLEMLIALSRRLVFQTEGASVAEWFWHLLRNVDLVISDYDYVERRMHNFVDQVLQNINNRTYETNGRGGLFPLYNPVIDQTKVELWYQMNSYLLERS